MKFPTRLEGMIVRICILTAVMALSGQAVAQAVPGPQYVESFRKGPVRVAERSIVANLSIDSPSFELKIKDSDGTDRYQFSLVPERVGEGDDRIIAWRVLLIDLQRKYLGNLLVATKPPGLLSDGPRDRAWWLDPNPYAVVPLRTERVFKVEDFYCMVAVADYHLTVPGRLLLDSMRVEARFTENNPLIGSNGAKQN
jgi:hypothetical protein